MPHSLTTGSDDSQLKKVIELDELSGQFEMDADGYWRFVPSPEEKASIERWLGEAIDRAEREQRVRLDAQAENRETYSFVKKMLDNEGGIAILPSPIARIPADQIIASTHNAIVHATPLFAMDPYFDASYPVLMPSPEYDPNDPDMAMLAGVPAGTAIKIDVGAEEISRKMESGIDFVARERLDFERVNHRVIDACVIEGYGWVKTCRKRKKRNIIRPKADSFLVDVEDTEEIEYNSGSQIQWMFVHDSNMLRPNMHQDINDLDWLAERDPQSPDDLRAAYANDEYFLYDDKKQKDAEVQRYASATSSTVDEAKVRTDAAIRKIDAEQTDNYLDIRDVWAYRWLHVKNEQTGESERRRFMLQLTYHHGVRKLLAAYRNPYNHQRRIHTVFTQFLDGSCTVGIVKYNQILGTHFIQSEIKSSFIANNPQPWHDPQATETATFLAKGMPRSPEVSIPGLGGKDWGYVPRGAEHYSLLPHIQWNAADAQAASKVGDYETRGSAPSHTSPNTVSMLLDRGGQSSLLFLSMMDRGWREAVRLYLETARQYQPLGEVIPVRDPKTRAKTMVPFRYPIGEALDNFRIALTAANDAASRERSPEQIMGLMNAWQQQAAFMMQPIGALINPATSPEQAKLYMKIIEGGQALLDRLVSTTRVDEETFNIIPEVMSVVAEKAQLLEQAKAQQATEAANAANQAPAGGGLVPPTEGAPDAGALAGVGAEPGVAVGFAAPPDEGIPVAGSEGQA